MCTDQQSKSVAARVLNVIKDTTATVPFNREDKLFDDLHFDSLDRVEVAMTLEEEFDINIKDSECFDWRTVEDVIECVERKARG